MTNLDKLSEYLDKIDANSISLSFSEIESILGSKLPDEAKQTGKWWWNVKGSKKARSWLDHSYETFDQKNIPARGSVCFKRIGKEPEIQKGFSQIWYFLTDKDAESHQKTIAILEILVIPALTILTLIATFATLYITMFPTKSQNQIKEDFASLVSEGEYAFENRNFLEAASCYHRATLTSYDIYSEAYSLQREGACYMIYGLEENDRDYLKRALMLYENIVNTPKYENTGNYQEAVIDLCYLYRALGYDWQDERWVSIVEQLEEMFNFNDFENISEEEIPTLISAAVNLSYYYKTVLLSDNYSFIFDEDSQQKAIYYSDAVVQLEIKYDEYHGVKIYDQTHLISIYELTSYIITNAFGNPKGNVLETLEEVRALCQDAILTIDLDAGNMLQLNCYIQLKRNIGKSYIFSAYASQSPEREDYMLKAYQELIPLFYWDDDEVTENIIHVSNYILSTGQCTEDDIQLILDRLLSYVQTIRENKDIPSQIYIELTGLVTCDSILLYYDYESSILSAQTVGQQLWTDLSTVLFDFLDSNQKAELATYTEKFGT